MGLFFTDYRKTINKPKLRSFTDAGWKGYNDNARLPETGMEPLIAELNYDERDYIIILICNKDDRTGRTAVQVLSPYIRIEKLFVKEIDAFSCGLKLTKTLSTLDNSKMAIEYCKEKEFVKITDNIKNE